MKKLIFVLSLVLVLGSGVKGFAATCTEDELKAKVTTLMTVIQDICQKDPEKCQKVSTEMQAKLGELQKEPTVDKLCKFYDDFLNELQK